MAYARPKDLDGFLPQLSKPDTRFRQQLGTDLLAFLADPENPDDCQDFGLFVDGLIPWLQSSNYKVSSNGIEVLTYLIDRLGPDFRPYLQTVFPNVVDRLGDAKDAVREKSQLLILKLLEKNVVQPQQLLERLQPAFAHKNAKIREEVLRCLVNTLNEHGTHSLTLSKFIPDIVNLLSDPSAAVRDSAHHTLVDLYKHVGERLRLDLQRRNIVPQAKWPALAAKFDEVRARGGTLATPKTAELNSYDELDKVTMATNSTNTIGKRRALPSATSVNSAGAVDKYSFIKYFEDCPTVQIFSSKEVTEHLKNIQDIISDVNKDWNKRVDALKKIRSLVVAGAVKYEEFHIGLRNLEIPLQGTLKDLRSQVVREACVTIAYLSQTLGNKFDKTAEVVLQHLINLIQNSAKVMATSGLNTVRFIIENTQSSRLIPLLTSNAIRSKSKDIRRACCEFLEYVLTQWQRQPMERHVGVLQEAVKTGIADADPEARLTSRRAFRSFRDHFPDQAEVLLQSLDPVYRKALQGEGMSASSSHNNIASSFKTPRQYGRSAAPSTTGSTENLSSAGGGLQRVPSLPRSYRHRSSVPVLTRENSGRKGFRSNSAIDLQAAQRAKARATYSALARNKIQSGTASLPRPRKSAETVITTASPERVSRRRSRSSQSQPTSRSGSPSSRLAYLYQHRPGATGSVDHHGVHESSPRPRLMSSGIPRSTHGSRDGSRETSPSRNTVSTLGRFRRSGGGERPPLSPASRPVLAQKILQQSREAENALADVFNNSTDHFRSPRRNMRSLDNQSDESETSSICSERSERSYDSFSRHCDSYSWSGSQQRLSSRDLWEPVRDINQIIAMCASTNWQERKDGLLSLQMYMSSEVPLSEGELKHLTEIFTKMFMDSHTKGLGVFLDTLHEVVRNYKHKLHYWIYVLLQRVFLKLGTETLSSIQSKLMATLEIIRSSFPANLLVANVYRFLIDATQTPNAKVKAIVMNFFTSLCNTPEAAQYISLPPASQALQKIITYAQDGKSVETRNAAKTCIVAMWNCNTPQVTMMLAELSKEHQDVASHIVHTHMRRSSAGSEPGSPVVISASSPKPLSPLRDGPDQEEIYRTLRRTTAEIQNYSFEIGLDRDTTSQDSGISQMSLGNDGVTREIQSLEERMEDLTLRPNFNMANRHGGPRSLPYTTVNGVTETDSNGFRSLRESTDSEQLLLTIIDNCFKEVDMSIADKRKLLLQLTSIVSSEDVECVKKHFKKLLKLLVDGLKEDPVTQIAVLQVLRAMFQNPELNDCWTGFVELVLLRVLDAHCVDRREVVKEAEVTAAAMCICPFSTILAILIPLITTSLYPYILGTIKMLTKMIETNPTKITDEHLKQIMPGLIKGADHHESPVRKSSIFCMVAIHKAVGEERLEPHISTLSGSKLKLFRLYVGRSEQTVPTSSVPTSPKNNTSVS